MIFEKYEKIDSEKKNMKKSTIQQKIVKWVRIQPNINNLKILKKEHQTKFYNVLKELINSRIAIRRWFETKTFEHYYFNLLADYLKSKNSIYKDKNITPENIVFYNTNKSIENLIQYKFIFFFSQDIRKDDFEEDICEYSNEAVICTIDKKHFNKFLLDYMTKQEWKNNSHVLECVFNRRLVLKYACFSNTPQKIFKCEECPVCLEKFSYKTLTFERIGACGHCVCVKCETSINKIDKKCPICRANFSPWCEEQILACFENGSIQYHLKDILGDNIEDYLDNIDIDQLFYILDFSIFACHDTRIIFGIDDYLFF